jgi:hypothetical protein
MGAETNAFAPRGVPAPATLASARVEVHWAAQIVAAVGRALIPAVPDDSHTSLEWLEAERLLLGGATPRGLRLGLRPADLTLVLRDPQDRNGEARRELPLVGRTLDEARLWAAAALGAVATVVPPYDMPPHAVAHGGTFSGGDGAALEEIDRWYAAADGFLREVRRTRSHPPTNASPVRCWPHHFDIATLIELPPGASVERRTIGVGLSPGDGSYQEPYFYVTPWPYPASGSDPQLPGLPGGAVWHRTGWFGAVLTATAIFAAADASPSKRAEAVSRFLDAAVGAAATLLGLAP